MADVSHELGSLRFVVDSPLSSKVAMFNNQVQQHKKSQLLNPFSDSQGNGRTSPKPTFSKDEYGKPLAGSMTEMRGQKANMHVLKEMLELCQIISSEGYPVNDEPTMRVIPFGELFNIYNYISDKVVGILLRARKHKLVEFEGEMLFQRRDDNVPIFLLKPVADIRHELEEKIADIKRAASPSAPQSTSVLLDKSAHQKKLEDAGLTAPKKGNGLKQRSVSPAGSQSKVSSKAASPAPEAKKPEAVEKKSEEEEMKPVVADTPKNEEEVAPVVESKETKAVEVVEVQQDIQEEQPIKQEPVEVEVVESKVAPMAQETPQIVVNEVTSEQSPAPVVAPEPKAEIAATSEVPQPTEMPQQADVASPTEIVPAVDELTTEVNNNLDSSTELPTIVIEASAVYVIGSADEQQS